MNIKTNITNQNKQLLAVSIIIFVGIFVTIVLVKLKKSPKKVSIEVPTPLVKVQQVHIRDIAIKVSGFGTVRPKVRIETTSQVSGKIVSVNDNFNIGGFIKTGHSLIEIDPRDYELALEHAQAVVAEAQVKLDLEKAEAEVSRREWKQLHPDSEPDSPLVFHTPQIQQYQARLKSAQAQLAKARLDLERTKITLPVDVCVIEKKVDIGQYVTPGQSVGSVYGTEVFEIELPLEDDDLAWFEIPAYDSNSTAALTTPAKIKNNFAGRQHIRTGYVKRTAGRVDPGSRLVSVIIEIPQPLETDGNRPALLPGTFVEVEIEDKKLKNAAAIPRSAIRDADKVWIVKDGLLCIRQLKIARTDRDFAYTTAGVSDGDLIILSSLDTAIDGMKVRIENTDTSTPKANTN